MDWMDWDWIHKKNQQNPDLGSLGRGLGTLVEAFPAVHLRLVLLLPFHPPILVIIIIMKNEFSVDGDDVLLLMMMLFSYNLQKNLKNRIKERNKETILFKNRMLER